MSLVSRRFHKLITSPHAWRIAFSRYFPGMVGSASVVTDELQKSEKKSFARLSALATWRSEYILRTRLLRSLGRGRPAVQSTIRPNGSRHSSNALNTPMNTYSSSLGYPVSHIHATFGVGLNKKQPLFIHGAVEQGAVSTSDPVLGKVGAWGLTDFENFRHFADVFVGEVGYGLGPGNVVGMPNLMDLSQQYGKLYGEACPGGRVFLTTTTEQRGRFLNTASSSIHELGFPEVTMLGCAVTSIWIAKSEPVLRITAGIFGCLAGFSNGVLAAYSIGINPANDRRYERGEPTAKWVLCPGVPIVAIQIDEKVSARRIGQKRIWATVLNALGEVFYLTEVSIRPETKGRLSPSELDKLAWMTGKSVD